jgi:hypothetical protein
MGFVVSSLLVNMKAKGLPKRNFLLKSDIFTEATTQGMKLAGDNGFPKYLLRVISFLAEFNVT